ncbi:unnamed protein product [Caenorhabditis brenneri]
MDPLTSVQKKLFSSLAVTESVRRVIKLLKFPLLVQLEIFKSMRLTDLFTLSLCSSRMYDLIKICKIRIPRLCYKEYKNGFWVYNRLDENNNEYIVFVSAVRKYKHDKDQKRATYGGVKVDFQWRPWGIEYIDEDYRPIQRMTQNHINGLFHLSDIDLELCRENLEQGGVDADTISDSLRPLAKNCIVPNVYKGFFRFIGYGERRAREWLQPGEQFMHFERETDQKIATLVYSEDSSTLLVWD